jgi:hypothetical protein
MINESEYIDRIHETENLTDELADADARWLLDWGIGQLGHALRDVSDETAADLKATALMSCMRKMNRIVGQRTKKNPKVLAVELEELASLFSRLQDNPSMKGKTSFGRWHPGS